MSDWVLIPCLVKLRSEFNSIAPNRDHASDGSIGDTAHQQEVSDHNPDETGNVPIHDADSVNEVHAIDVDNNLNEAGMDMEDVVQFLLKRCKNGSESRLRYIIYNRRIWRASNGWGQETYTGSSPHTEHAHFSASYDSSKEASTASWHLEDIPVAITDADIDRIVSKIFAKDIDPSGDATYSAGGALWTTLVRSAKIDADVIPYPGATEANPTVSSTTALKWILQEIADLQVKLDALTVLVGGQGK